MKKLLTILLSILFITCSDDNIVDVTGYWTGYSVIGGHKWYTEFDFIQERNTLYGRMIFYNDTMDVIQPSYVIGDSISFNIKYTYMDVPFRYKGIIMDNIIKGEYIINGRIEEFKIHRE
ncbi:MAG: hypothetical protein ACP5OA_03435 [Candidatus Woesearchaeota archaeon]